MRPELPSRLMYSPHLGTVNVLTISTAVAMAIGMIITGLCVYVMPKIFPRLRRPEVSFWVFFGILMVTSIGSMFVLSTLQARATQGQHQK
jgi:hypothetical protein